MYLVLSKGPVPSTTQHKGNTLEYSGEQLREISLGLILNRTVACLLYPCSIVIPEYVPASLQPELTSLNWLTVMSTRISRGCDRLVERGSELRSATSLLPFVCTAHDRNTILRRMPSSGMLRRVALVRTDVSQQLSASIIRVTRIGASVASYG
jgi:hypothetical protein